MADGEAWQQLAERLLDHGYPGGPETGVQVVLGGLPKEVDRLIPIPDGWRVVGSSLRRIHLGHPAQMLDVVVDADGSPAAALAAFAAAAEAAGWRPHEDDVPMPSGGFVPASRGADVRSFVQGELLLRALAVQRPGTSLDVRLLCNTQEMRQQRRAPHGVPLAASHMPPLRAPQGIELSPRGGGGSMDHYQSDATIDGSATVGELHAHFGAQLVDARWQLIHQGGDDRAAWSAWQLPDPGWHGVLMVLNPSGGRRTSLLLRVESAEEDRKDGWSFAEFAGYR